MPLPVTNQAFLDVLADHDLEQGVGGREPHALSAPWTRLVVGLALVTLVAAVALSGGQDDSRAAVVEASGSMVLEHHYSQGADRLHSTQEEDENAYFSGPIQLELPDRQLVGFAQLRFSFAATMDDDRPWIVHAWGAVRAIFGSTTCHGPFAWSYYREPHETGGSLNLRCDDGSVFAAAALVEGDEDSSGDRPYRAFVALRDGWYVAG